MSTKENLIEILKKKTATQEAVQKILVEDLLAAIPEGEDDQLLSEALEVYKRGTTIEFKDESSDLPTGGHYTYKDNVIRIAKSGDEVDMAHTILFETYNAHHATEFRIADTTFANQAQTPLEYGNSMATIEGMTTEKYIKLIRIIQHSNKKNSPPMSKSALHQLTACRDCQTTNDFVVLTKLTSHSSAATDHTAMMSPKVYAYEKVRTMGRLTAVNKMKKIIATKSGNDEVVGLKQFGYWFSNCWRTATAKQHPKLWLEAGAQASEVFAHDMSTNKVDPVTLGFEGPMADMATRDARGWTVPKFKSAREYIVFRSERNKYNLPA